MGNLEVERFHFGSGPGGFSQEFEAAFDGGVCHKTANAGVPGQGGPAMVRHQTGEHHLKGDAVKRVSFFF